jgi:hypothetical protein
LRAALGRVAAEAVAAAVPEVAEAVAAAVPEVAEAVAAAETPDGRDEKAAWDAFLKTLVCVAMKL